MLRILLPFHSVPVLSIQGRACNTEALPRTNRTGLSLLATSWIACAGVKATWWTGGKLQQVNHHNVIGDTHDQQLRSKRARATSPDPHTKHIKRPGIKQHRAEQGLTL